MFVAGSFIRATGMVCRGVFATDLCAFSLTDTSLGWSSSSSTCGSHTRSSLNKGSILFNVTGVFLPGVVEVLSHLHLRANLFPKADVP
ncbi:hypothetical protein L210DRAFT_3561838 [Boletus edulis BED1]|uniref:Uncharacterized protein n=1 Tax=Boletus edulis BED1 TaxID=1328754 RepID=A0AAD4G4U8_BOLED|nr:hypothetical protein L210DRAFT_3587832 [Boletus edulis BED1]KAF8420577.1 hypothetical protein L210DRAFT_3574519 [Boletus edulis BED1]KAF8430701.1 hypothetical protein L210DRAFT_3561838 [Boletus edulis BED1]